MAIGLNSIKEIFNRAKSEIRPNRPSNDLDSSGTNSESFLAAGPGPDTSSTNTYSVSPENWYSAKPYGFKASLRDGRNVVMFLPISPSNLTISTEFATNMIPTLYGTVEEHSDVRYFDISIEGTTGMAPKFVSPYIGNKDTTPDKAYPSTVKGGRASFSVAEGLALGGFFPKTLGVLNQLKNKAADLLNGGVKPKTGIVNDNTGYVAFHNLYRFLLQHKKDAAGVANSTERKDHPLTFFNYKDNNEYDVVVKSFSMRRSADNPMLYFYSIQLRGYNLRSIKKGIDENLRQRLADLGLNGVDSSSILGDIKSLSRNARSIVGSLAGGINVLGR
jgi:hypothetical protein